MKAGKAKKKNPAAVALGKRRAALMTQEQRIALAAKAGTVGGRVAAENMSDDERRARARKAARARWGKNGSKALLVVALLFFQNGARAEAPADVDGWQAAHWGMSPAEVVQAFEGKAFLYGTKRPGWSMAEGSAGIDAWPVGKVDYHVIFTFDPEGKLQQVMLRPHQIRGAGGLPSDPPVFDELTAMLTDKYAKASTSNVSVDQGLRWNNSHWSFPSTTIDLKTSTHIRFGFSLTTLIFSKRGKDQL